jgi:hypothetical protein
MAIPTSSFIQHRCPKSSGNNDRPPLPSRPPPPPQQQQQQQDRNGVQKNSNHPKRPRLERYHAFLVYWNNFYYMTTSLVVKVRSWGISIILISILIILLFHPPCYRQRAKGMTLCRISRNLGIIPSLPPKQSKPTNNVRKRKREKSRREYNRILLGFMSYGNDREERRRRIAIRKKFLMARNMGKPVCSLQDYLVDTKRSCRIVYSFVMGGNPQGIHLNFNKTYTPTLKFEQTSFFLQEQQRLHATERVGKSQNPHLNLEKDVVFFNVQDLNNVRKVFAWFLYTTMLKLATFRQFDYVGFANTHYFVDIDRFLANKIFDSTEMTENTYGGILLQKSNCDKQWTLARKENDCFEACPKVTSDVLMREFVVLSRDMIDYCLAHIHLVQLNGVYPQNCPDLTIASLLGFHLSPTLNTTYLDGILYSQGRALHGLGTIQKS